MSVSQNDLLSQAKQLLLTASTELDFRNVIGRAYYAAYHEATRFHDSLPTRGKDPSKTLGMHAELAFRLQSPTIPQSDPRFYKSQNIGRHLGWLHEKRVKADYRLRQTLAKSESEEVVARAARLFELCSEAIDAGKRATPKAPPV